jgi:4-hydroxy-tetrahydrodipicolinate synthase
MYRPEGVYAAMLTSFSEDGSINEGETRRIVDFLCDAGVDGLFPVSSVGEYIHMSVEQKIRLTEIVVDQNRGRVKVTPGVGSTTPTEAIYLAEKAKEMGCDGVVVAPPYFFPLSQEMIEKYFETILDGVDIPLILYNIPLFTQPVSYDVVTRLSRHKNLVGVKDSSGSMVDFLHFLDKIRLEGGDTNLLTGREETFLACLMMGGKGCMTASSGILPEILVGIYKEWQKGDIDQARELQFSLLVVVRAMFALPFPVGFKVALETRGFKMGPPRQPLSNAEQYKFNTVKARIEKIMRPLLEGLDKGQ